jgi:hypothetical protein
MASDSIIKETPAYMIMDGGFVLDAPVDVAWPCVTDFPRWQGFSLVERAIEGVVDEENEVFRLCKEEVGFEWPGAYYARTLMIDPGSRIVWKTFPTDVPEGTGYFGIVDFRLEPEGEGRSRFTYHVVYEFNGPFASEADRRAFSQAESDNFEVLWASIGPKLRQLVASRESSVH